jgi:vacuolar-type H+-ATPase subunit D/Vma8
MSVERRYELETLRRSLAMLRPGAPALDREEAMRLVRELQDLERQLRTLRRGLQELLSEIGGPKSAAGRARRPPVS